MTDQGMNDRGSVPGDGRTCTGRWIVSTQGGPNQHNFEIAVVREDNALGIKSYGWFNEGKCLVSSSGGPGRRPISERIWDGLVDLARTVALEMNEAEGDPGHERMKQEGINEISAPPDLEQMALGGKVRVTMGEKSLEPDVARRILHAAQLAAFTDQEIATWLEDLAAVLERNPQADLSYTKDDSGLWLRMRHRDDEIELGYDLPTAIQRMRERATQLKGKAV